MTTNEFNALTLPQQAAALRSLRALLAAIYADRGGATEPPALPVTRRGVRLGTARTGLRGRDN